MFVKVITRTALVAVLAVAGSQAFGQASTTTSNSFGGSAPSSQSIGSSNPAEGPTFQFAPQNPTTIGRPGGDGDGLYAARMEACDEAGGFYVVGPVCFDREGNAINM